jgi:hypothetical protein
MSQEQVAAWIFRAATAFPGSLGTIYERGLPALFPVRLLS